MALRLPEPMSKARVPDDVRRFLLTSIPSVPYLEALLLLRAEDAASWDAPKVARRLYIGESQAHALLQALQEAGIARQLEDATFAYAPAATVRELLDALAATYARDLVGVTDLIHSRSEKHAQQFADAFRWKKDGG
jgi:hypothetical protein